MQVYVTWPSTNLVVPRIQLVAFTRELFRAGEHRLVNLVITPERYAVWGDNGWTFVKGNLECNVLHEWKASLFAGALLPIQC